MKYARIKILVVLFLFAVTLAACSTFVGNTYKTMYVTAQAYDTGMKVVADLQKQGKITDEQRAQINDTARKFWASYQIAAVTLSVYNKSQTEANKDSLVWAITEMSTKWKVFVEAVNAFRPGTINVEVE